DQYILGPVVELSPIPADAESAVDACADALRLAILRGDLAPGERLPAERRLAERFGVNRVTVRSALAQLATRGLLSVRQGSGYVVQDYRRVGGLDLVPSLADLGEGDADYQALARDLLQVRRQLAVVVLERLVERADPAALAGVRAAIDAFTEVATPGADPLTVAEADLEVLAALLEATGSRVLQLCFNPVLQVVLRLERLRAAIYAEPETNAVAYRALLAWLDAGPDASGELDPRAVLDLLTTRDARTLARLSEAAPTAEKTS
ncbi:MAG TPA: GntR family transcriptional regulator, partial [Polyangiaceae bacterium LLY-WYZ-15_(1-7)]|nr:GntR family transcriptional regulator [Polyangiaceae bacterium LLY-WYZ-15_(1-7)]